MNPKCLGRSVPDTFGAKSAHLTGLKMRRITRAASFDHLVGAGEQHRFVSLTRSSMVLDCLAIAVSVLLSAGIRNAWAIMLGSSPAQGRLVASYLTELVLQIAHLHPNVPGWENGRI